MREEFIVQLPVGKEYITLTAFVYNEGPVLKSSDDQLLNFKSLTMTTTEKIEYLKILLENKSNILNTDTRILADDTIRALIVDLNRGF